MSFFKRLDALEDFWRDDGRMSELDAQTELLRQFAKESVDNGAVLDRSVAIVKSLNVSRLVRNPACGELRRALGNYCRAKRYRFPGASVTRCRRGTNVITIGGDGKLLQIMAELPLILPEYTQ